MWLSMSSCDSPSSRQFSSFVFFQIATRWAPGVDRPILFRPNLSPLTRSHYVIFYWRFHRFFFSSFQFWKELLFWNSRRENGDAKKTNHFLTLERQVRIISVAWISVNQIAIGLDEGGIEICEIDEDEGTSRVVKLFIHGDYVSRKEGRRTWNIWWRFSILFWWRLR